VLAATEPPPPSRTQGVAGPSESLLLFEVGARLAQAPIDLGGDAVEEAVTPGGPLL
jgi:hypothetical protein